MRGGYFLALMACLLISEYVHGADVVSVPYVSAMNSREGLEQFLDNTKVNVKTWNKNRAQYIRLSWGGSEPATTPLDDKFRITFVLSENEGKAEHGIVIYIHNAFTKKQPNGFEEYLFFLDYVKKKYPDKFEFNQNQAYFYMELSSSDSFANVLFPLYDKSENWPNTTKIGSMMSFYSHNKEMDKNLRDELVEFVYVKHVFNWMVRNNFMPKGCMVTQGVYFGGDVLIERWQIIHASSLGSKLNPKKSTYPNMNIALFLKCSKLKGSP